MRLARRSFALFALLALVASAGTARADVLKIVVDDMIHPITDEFIGRAIDRASQEKYEAVLIELRTPGGLSDSTRKIVEKILASPVPIIVWVAPSGARAASAGFYILQAADVAAMAPGTNTGAASPVMLGAGGEDSKPDDTMKAKMQEDSAAFMRSFVSKRGRNVKAAESAVREAKSFTDDEALKDGIIDVVANSDEELLQKLDGRTVRRFDGSETKLSLAGAKITRMEMTLKQRILAFIMDPNIAFLLFSLGMLALYAEFNNPGAVLPGVVGLICVLLALFALNVLPTRYAALALIVAAFILFALEAQIASHGVLGAGGVLALVLGGLLLVDGPIPEMRVQLVTALAVAIPVGVITIFLLSLVVRVHRKKSITGEQGIVGEVGVARTPLVPQGKVFVHGELWDAVAAVPVNPGEQVLVRSIEGLLLQVEPLSARAGERSPATT